MEKIIFKDTDLLIIGGGMAGTLAAIEARKRNVPHVTIVEKNKVGRSGTTGFAAGVLRVFFPEDDYDVWLKECVELEQFTYNQKWLEICLRDIYGIVKEMDSWGVQFRKKDGKFERIMGRGSSTDNVIRNIMFHGGPQLMSSLRKKCDDMQVEMVDRVMVTALLVQDNRGIGAMGFDTRTGDLVVFNAKATILAAGGHRFKSIFIGHRFVAGDMYAAFYRAGGELGRCEYCNYNTTCTEFDTAGLNMFVGLGGKFINNKGEAFMANYSPRYKERSEQDILAASMAMEVRHGRGPIHLDMTHFTPKDVSYLRAILPVATRALERAGVMVGDKIVRRMPWIPNGPGTESHGAGIVIDMQCKTSIEGFFAAGGTANNDYNGMGWAVVSGVKAGEFAAGYIKDVQLPRASAETIEEARRFTMAPLERKKGISHDHILLAVQETIMPYEVYLIRHADRLNTALKEIERIKDTQLPYIQAYDPHYLRMAHEAANLLVCAEMLLRSALVRKESRLGHLRDDYPETDNIDWMKWTKLKKEGGKMVVGTRDMPVETFPVKPERKRFKHPIFAAEEKLNGKAEV